MAVTTSINYFDLSNDRVFYPGTAGYQRRKFDTKHIEIEDVRGREEEFTLETNGFQVLREIWSGEDVEDVPDHIHNVVFPETIEAVKKVCVFTRELKPVYFAHSSYKFQNRCNRCPAILASRSPTPS